MSIEKPYVAEGQGEETEQFEELDAELTALGISEQKAEQKNVPNRTARKAAVLALALAAFLGGTEKAEAGNGGRVIDHIANIGTQILNNGYYLQRQREAAMQRRAQQQDYIQERARETALRHQEQMDRQNAMREQMEMRHDEQGQREINRHEDRRDQVRERYCTNVVNNRNFANNPKLQQTLEDCNSYLFSQDKQDK